MEAGADHEPLRGGHALQDIADQVDIEPSLVEKVIELAKKQQQKQRP
ncbi:hypothetical protein [Nitrososphaera sp.]